MKTIMMAGLALCALSTAAFAEPQKMTEEQMSGVSAGLNGALPAFLVFVSTFETDQTNTAAQVGSGAAVNLLGGGTATSVINQTIAQVNGPAAP